MGKIYAKAVLNGTRTLDSIGTMWRAATIAALQEMCTEEEFAQLTGE